MFFTEFLPVFLSLSIAIVLGFMPIFVMYLQSEVKRRDKTIFRYVVLFGLLFLFFSVLYLYNFPVDAERMKERDNEISIICRTHYTYINNGYTKPCPSPMSHSAN